MDVLNQKEGQERVSGLFGAVRSAYLGQGFFLKIIKLEGSKSSDGFSVLVILPGFKSAPKPFWANARGTLLRLSWLICSCLSICSWGLGWLSYVTLALSLLKSACPIQSIRFGSSLSQGCKERDRESHEAIPLADVDWQVRGVALQFPRIHLEFLGVPGTP